MRGMCATMLILEAIILALATPVMISVEGVDKTLAVVMGIGLAVVCILTAGLLSRPWGYYIGHAIQVAAISLGFVVSIMFFVGAMFAALWIGAYVLGRKIAADKAAWVEPQP